MSIFSVPVAYAATTTVEGFIHKVDQYVINPIIVFMFAVALVVFMWGVIEFVANRDSDDARTTGRQHMLWGIVGIFIMMAVYAILKIIINTFGITGVSL